MKEVFLLTRENTPSMSFKTRLNLSMMLSSSVYLTSLTVFLIRSFATSQEGIQKTIYSEVVLKKIVDKS